MPAKRINTKQMDTDNETSDSGVETKSPQKLKFAHSKAHTNKSHVDSESESESDNKLQSKMQSKPHVNSDNESDSDDEEAKVVIKTKKVKQSSVELSNDKNELLKKMEGVNKVIEEALIQLTKAHKERVQLQKQFEKIEKLHVKVNSDDLEKCKKEKPKRKGTGGFKQESVPETLRKFLDLPDDAVYARPTLNGLLNNKLKLLNLKKGREAHLDKPTCKALGLDVDEKIIKFEQFMGFINSFYPPKQSK
jgi:hypothetical protein